MRVALTSVLASSSFFPAHSTAWLRRLAWEAVAIYSFFSLSLSLSFPPARSFSGARTFPAASSDKTEWRVIFLIGPLIKALSARLS